MIDFDVVTPSICHAAGFAVPTLSWWMLAARIVGTHRWNLVALHSAHKSIPTRALLVAMHSLKFQLQKRRIERVHWPCPLQCKFQGMYSSGFFFFFLFSFFIITVWN